MEMLFQSKLCEAKHGTSNLHCQKKKRQSCHFNCCVLVTDMVQKEGLIWTTKEVCAMQLKRKLNKPENIAVSLD